MLLCTCSISPESSRIGLAATELSSRLSCMTPVISSFLRSLNFFSPARSHERVVTLSIRSTLARKSRPFLSSYESSLVAAAVAETMEERPDWARPHDAIAVLEIGETQFKVPPSVSPPARARRSSSWTTISRARRTPLRHTLRRTPGCGCCSARRSARPVPRCRPRPSEHSASQLIPT